MQNIRSFIKLITVSLLGSTPLVMFASDLPTAPAKVVKLIFIHHSTGENWLADWSGKLADKLQDNNYFVSDTNYGWGPDKIGDSTDTGHWWKWFSSPESNNIFKEIYMHSKIMSPYGRWLKDPKGENEIIMFKSCYPNSHMGGNFDDKPTLGKNPLNGKDAWSKYMNISNAKGIYNDLLNSFRQRNDKLFVLITSPPLVEKETDAKHAKNIRSLNNWLVNDWLNDYPHKNVIVFDYYNVLSSNGGSRDVNDISSSLGNHHRWNGKEITHVQLDSNNFSSYGESESDSHPTKAGNLKATSEFIPLLNFYYNRWKSK